MLIQVARYYLLWKEPVANFRWFDILGFYKLAETKYNNKLACNLLLLAFEILPLGLTR